MAFAIDSFNISNMSYNTDGWVVQLSMVWFNYAPYGSNFLFRNEWETVDLNEYDSVVEDPNAPGYRSTSSTIIRKSIGWYLPDSNNKKVPKPCITYRSVASFRSDGMDESAVDVQSVTEKGLDFAPMSILDMERVHEGFEWDLLPKVSMMNPADANIFPIESKIYKRFYNYMQRDALWLNFGIDIELLLETEGVPVSGFFGVWDAEDSKRRETWALHTGPIMEDATDEERLKAKKAWQRVMRQVREMILDRNGKIHFAYNV